MAALRRIVNWESALARHLEVGIGRPFAWGEHDCVLFALDGVRETTGADLAAPLRGRYFGVKSALAYLRANGGSLSAMIERLLGEAGLRAVEASYASRGDLALLANRSEARTGSGLPEEFDGALALIAGSHAATVPPAGSIRYVPLALALKAWRI